MKKKILILFIFFLSVPLSAFATSTNLNNLIAGKIATLTNKGAGGDLSKALTNGVTTDYNLYYASQVYTYNFDTPVNISKLVVYTNYDVSRNVKMNVTLKNDKTYTVAVPADIAGTGILVNYSDVVSVSFSSVGNMWISEFQVFDDSVLNTDADKFVINNLTASPVSLTTINVNWDRINSPFFKSYCVYVNNVLMGSPTTNFYNYGPVSLTPGKAYVFKVTSLDINNKEFAPSEFGYTAPPPDTTPPSVPKLLGSTGSRSVSLQWTPSPENDLAGYTVYQDGQAVRKVGRENGISIAGLSNDKSYRFSVTAFDTSGNESARSNEVELTPKSVITETEQETGPDYLLVKWTKTEGATGYRIYLNGRLIGSVGPTVFEYKITRAMGYIPGAISNKAEARAILSDGTEGGSNNPTAPTLELGAGYSVGDAFRAGIEFVKLLNGWMLIALAIVLANMIIAFLYLLNKKYKITQRG
ncbi:fibronectin type III domain-containing protein [Paenibacillus polymyxa]|nr:fibronectin type III domain-containing protein [Paenibacillus polymyxa]